MVGYLLIASHGCLLCRCFAKTFFSDVSNYDVAPVCTGLGQITLQSVGEKLKAVGAKENPEGMIAPTIK